MTARQRRTINRSGGLLPLLCRRLTQLKEEAEGAVRELQQLRRGRVSIGANEGAVHTFLPRWNAFGKLPHAQVEVDGFCPSDTTGITESSIDFGVLTFQPRERSLLTVPLGEDELVVLTHPDHPLSKRSTISMEEFGQQTVIATTRPRQPGNESYDSTNRANFS
ncbi:MAG: hypothetical protein Ct9H300mP25_10470 [Acidobacteriota bacterium]|nr:MAG: hypothetical protein Ct9H300mP25_10470 [Acidobacteriota bacterium]